MPTAVNVTPHMRAARKERIFLYGAALVVCVLLGVGSLYAVYALRESATARMRTTTQNLASSLNQTVEGVIDLIDVALLVSADEIKRQNVTRHPDRAAITRFLALQTGRVRHVAYLRATNADGEVIYGLDLPAITVHVADRDFFMALQKDPDAGLYMGKPVISKISGKPVMPFARRVNNADGGFAGVVYASINLDELTDVLARMEVQPGGSLALRHRDMSLIVRTVSGAENPIPMGSTQISQTFERAMQSNPRQGTYVSDSTSLDPTPRVSSYRRSEKYGYLVNVGLPLEVELQGWRQQAAVLLGLSALLAVAALVLARQISQSRSRLQDLVESLHQSQGELESKNSALAQTEQRQRGLLENLQTGLVVHAPDTSILFSNALASRLLGLTKEQMNGKTAIDPAWCFVDASGRVLTPREYPISRVIGNLKSFTNEVLGVRVPEREAVTWLEVSAFPEFNSDGSLKQVVVNFFDITLRRNAEELRERATRALRLVSDTNITLARSEDEHQLLEDICRLLCDKGGYRMAWVGYAQLDAKQTVSAVAQWGFVDGYLDGIQLSWSDTNSYGRGPLGVALRLQATQVNRNYLQNPQMEPWRDAALAHGYRSSIALPFSKKSGARGVISIYAAEEGAFAADEVTLLEELAGNLAYGLDAIEDRQRRIDAEFASRAKADFLANMSHEIRTPLNAISGMAQLIRKEELSREQSARLDKLEGASRHLLRIIDAVLDLSKIDAGKLTLESAPVRVEQVVANVVSMVSDRARAKSLELISEVPPLPANLMGDATRLQQALLNYASNAVKFTDSGTVTLRAMLLDETDDGVTLRLEVADTGIGIEPTALQRLFEAFEQADNSITRKYGGTGLGLAITAQLARLMGGEAGVTSTLGQGSTFWFTVRLQKDVQADFTDSNGETEELQAQLHSIAKGRRVLVAEDEPVNCEIITYLLEEVGFVVDVAQDGMMAVELAQVHTYDLILMDMQMPRVSGLEATRAIRQIPRYRDVQIVAMTANAFVEDRLRCLEAGMNDFVTKPLPARVLYATLLRALKASAV